METGVVEQQQMVGGIVSDELLQLVSFNIGDEEFGVDILKVQEINRMVEINESSSGSSLC